MYKCSFIGILPAGAVSAKSYYQDYIWPSHISDIHCVGTESTIWDCPYNRGSNVCTGDASVACQSE